MPHDEGHEENAERRFAHARRKRNAQEIELSRQTDPANRLQAASKRRDGGDRSVSPAHDITQGLYSNRQNCRPERPVHRFCEAVQASAVSSFRASERT